MNKKIISAIALALLVVLFVAINIVSNNELRSQRFDLTQEKLYTLSDGSKRVIGAIDEPVTLRLYYSTNLANDIPTFRTYALRVRELIEEYVTLSNGRIRLEVIDPKPFTEDEDNAIRFGMQGVPVNDSEKLYFGLVGFNMTDDQEVIPFFQQQKEAFLEYELTRLIYKLSDPKKAVVGLVTGHQMNANVSPMMRLNPRAPKPWVIIDQIRETFELKVLEANFDKIEDNIEVLLLIHPPKLSDASQYAIDQFVLRGGKALIFLDPVSEIAAGQARARQGQPPQTMISADLPKLLAAWGVEMKADQVVGDWDIAREVNIGRGGNTDIIRYLPWLKLASDNYNREDIVTAQLGNLMYAAAGAIVPLEGATTELKALIFSTSNAMLIKADDIKYGPDPRRLVENFEADGVQHVIAARITGTVKSAFPDGAPKAPAEVTENDKEATEKKDQALKTEHLNESTKDLQVILVSDADNLYDNFWAQSQNLGGQRIIVQTSANASFLINALDNLAGSSDLIGLRSRERSERPFLVVEKLRRQAEQKFLARENELNKNLDATQRKIVELQSKAEAEGGALLSDQQQAAIDEARIEILNTRRELRQVQASLNSDIELLERRVKMINIAAVPSFFIFVAIGLGLLRHRRRRRAYTLSRS